MSNRGINPETLRTAANAEPRVDVMVRYEYRTGYRVASSGVPFSMAARIVQKLRSDPRVAWAYCTEPDDLSAIQETARERCGL